MEPNRRGICPPVVDGSLPSLLLPRRLEQGRLVYRFARAFGRVVEPQKYFPTRTVSADGEGLHLFDGRSFLSEISEAAETFESWIEGL